MLRLSAAIIISLAFAVTATPSLGTTTAPTPPPPTPGPLGYYFMQGSHVISAPFADVNACTKALLKFQHDNVGPGVDRIVCAHRRP
jgi:hypothetical protein